MMNIEVVGPGCPFCRKLYQRTQEAVAENGIDAEVKHVTDLKTTMKYVPMTPVLLVDGNVVHRGKRIPKKEKIAELLSQEIQR
jgi:small redox-active disulfide protein 2